MAPPSIKVISFENECKVYMGSSTETVAFQVHEILKINREFLQIFWLGQKYNCLRHHFQYLAQFIALRGGFGAVQIFSIHDYGTSFAVVSKLWIFLDHSLHGNRFAFTMVSIRLPLSSYRHPIHRRNSSLLRKNDGRSSFGKYRVLLCLPIINFLYDSILFSIISINPSLN